MGVELVPGGDAHARVWAPKCSRVEIVLLYSHDAGPGTALVPEADGYFSGLVTGVEAGTRYKFRLDGELTPDPASRYQPDGPHGPSQIVDAAGFAWTDQAWRGIALPGQVIYELHIGTFTPEGSYRAAIEHLPQLAELGVTSIEVMPLAEFAGRFGWGYDGVALFAPFHHYGSPDDLRALVDAAHANGIGVLLDVVYNHLGPDGNYLKRFSDHYFKGSTEWGEALNFDGEQSAPVRELFLSNAAYWIDEFHCDGLRLDATQQIFDESTPHILAEVATRVHAAAGARATLLVAENEPQHTRLLRPRGEGGYGLDALWNDDFHHSAIVAVTGRSEAYYSGYTGSAQELVSAVKYGYLYQGQWYGWQLARRGTPAFDIAPRHFVHFIQNHDQVANSGAGLRLHALTTPGRHRAITALVLLAPETPMLFQGQEFAASAPFLYFADHNAELARLVRHGRSEFLGQFASLAARDPASFPDPADPRTFERCKLDWGERRHGSHACALALVRDLLCVRRDDPTIAAQAAMPTGTPARAVDGAVLGEEALLLRFFGERDVLDRLLLVNLGRQLHPPALAEPLAAPPAGSRWRPLWSSEDPRYGGPGLATMEADEGGWWLPAESAVLLAPVPRAEAAPALPQPASEKDARAQWKARHAKTAG
ncbi:MAG TPA: malto-oligosyltrehalose trehalohydrolase [Gemmatimonadaceae bacterium]|nr:malto-oligosyltrehalose trehalohydrolase [Gemmatimonadaceae bacterium]